VWEWIQSSEGNAFWLWFTVVPIIVFIFLLLVYISLPESWRIKRKEILMETSMPEMIPALYQRIGVAIDHTATDSRVLSHALTLARQNNAEIILFHIVEGVAVQLFGKEADDKEVRSDESFLHEIARQLQQSGMNVQPVLGYGKVAKELVRLSRENKIDLLVMGGHRHHGAQDLIFGTSISKVRHELSIPVLIV
jgi:manganese transport protein